jgi:hypothetical protein
MGSEETTPVTGSESTPTPSNWDKRVGMFAKAVNKGLEELNNALKNLTGDPSDAALDILSDPTSVTDDDLKKALVDSNPPGIPLGVFRKNLSVLRGPQATAPAAVSGGVTASSSVRILPELPDSDASFLDMLKVGGVMKVSDAAYIAALRAGIAEHLKLFDLPARIRSEMRAHAKSLGEPVGKSYYRLDKIVARRRYADIFNALDIENPGMSETDKNELLDQVNTKIWPALSDFQVALVGWHQSWAASSGGMNPLMAIGAIANAIQGGRSGSPMPVDFEPPETTTLRSQAESTIDRINTVFAGIGIPVAVALAYDASKVKEVLEDPELPANIGAVNKDQMLKKLGIDIGSEYIDLERNITQYGLSVTRFPKMAGSPDEIVYLQALLRLGMQINWEKLPGTNVSSDVIRRPNTGRRDGSPTTRRDPIGVGSGRGPTHGYGSDRD